MRVALLILILAALVGTRVAQKRGRPGLAGPSVLLALLALGISLTFALRSPPPAYLHRLEPFHRSVGYMLGRSVRDTVPDVTKVILLQDRREEATVQRLTTQQAEGLLEGIGRDDCELVYVSIRDIVGTGVVASEERIDRKAVLSSYDKFKAVMEAHPEADTIVSFAGYPSYVRLLLRRGAKVRFFAWDLGTDESVDWNAEIAKGRVVARVGYKHSPNMQASVDSSTPLEEIFALRYELVTAP